MSGNRIFGHLIRHYGISLVIIFWLFMLIYVLMKNPSADDASEKMEMMKGNMATLLLNGGRVVYRNENAKFGGALLSILIRTDSWSKQLMDMDTKALIDLGWKQISIDPDSFCKQGVLAEILENSGNYKNMSTVHISMKYNATTIKTCM